MKPFMFYSRYEGEWRCSTGRCSGATAMDPCPFVAYALWMEQSLKAGEK